MLKVVQPPPYMSRAKLMLRFVVDSQGVGPVDKDSQQVKAVDPFGQAVIGSEMQILTSLDVALEAAAKVGPEKILAQKGGGTNLLAAAGTISSDLEVEVPSRTTILSVSFKNPDKSVVQPVLDAVIQTYMRKHLEVHHPPNEYFERKVEEWRGKLAEHEEELKKLKSQAHVLFVDDTKRSYQTQISKIQDELLEAKKDLEERKAILGDLGSEGAGTNDLDMTVPPDKVSDYSFAASGLESLKRRERELLLQYKPAHPTVLTVRGQIESLKKQKEDLEREYPALTLLGTSGVSRGATNEASTTLSGDASDLRLLGARVVVLGTLLTNIQAEAERVLQLEPQITQAQRQRDEAEKKYEFFLNNLGNAQKSELQASGNSVNMSVVQNPSPPGLDLKKFQKLAAIVLAGCIGLGLALAFAVEFFFDRSLKRSIDVERHLHIPVMLTIPDTRWKRRLGWSGLSGGGGSGAKAKEGATAVVRWDPADQLQYLTAGLRERLVTHFELRNLNQKKPKLVAVTGCSEGAGVTTLAGGLAAELSRTGDGNVLLVDMNSDQGIARSFHQGKPGCGIAEVLESDFEDDRDSGEGARSAGYPVDGTDKLAKVMPANFLHMVPKINVGEYDYIVFDMPPVSPTSATPRLAAHMDLVLLVLEAERTGQATAKRAGTLMRESKANVAAILNKFRPHVPASLSSDA